MRVGFDETDAQAVVYYGRYFPYFDRARVEYQRHLQLLHTLPAGLEFVMRRVAVRVRGARALRRRDRGLHPHGRDRPHLVALGDGRAPAASRARCSPHAEQVMVLIDRAARKPHPVPDGMREAVEAFEAGA